MSLEQQLEKLRVKDARDAAIRSFVTKHTVNGLRIVFTGQDVCYAVNQENMFKEILDFDDTDMTTGYAPSVCEKHVMDALDHVFKSMDIRSVHTEDGKYIYLLGNGVYAPLLYAAPDVVSNIYLVADIMIRKSQLSA